MNKQIIRIATRQSPLALWQAEHVAERLRAINPALEIELVKMVTRGDKILDAPLAKIGGKGLFVKELEQGMLDGETDIAVHSMKDVPMEFPEGLGLSAILMREEPSDAFVATRYASINELPVNAKIGTSSLRRQCQIKEKFPQAEVLPLRGNVNTRLAKLDAGDYDAIILAAAGLIRLELAARITEMLPVSYSLPAIGQGAIGIESRTDDAALNDLLAQLNDRETVVCVRAERALNARLMGGCQVPIAGYAIIQQGELFLRGLVGAPDGSILYKSEATGDLNNPEQLGQQVAEHLLSQGADKILQALQA